MDSKSSSLSLLASKTCLTLLISPSSPLFSLFTPLSFDRFAYPSNLNLNHPVRHSQIQTQTLSIDGRGKGTTNLIEELMIRLSRCLNFVRLDLVHDGRKSLIETVVTVLESVDAHLKALKTLCRCKAVSSEEGNILMLTWVQQLLSKALKILDKYVTDITEAAKVCRFVTPPSGKMKGKKEASASKSMLKAVTAAFTIGSLILICPSVDLQGITPLLHTIITSGNSEAKPKKLANLTVSVKSPLPCIFNLGWQWEKSAW